jgi:carbamoyl-phosphate synthase large subunit
MSLGLGGKYHIVKSGKRGCHTDVTEAIADIGLPCVVKSLDKSGGCGVRFVRETLDYSNFEGKPDGWISFSDLMWMLGDKSYELLVTKYFPGKEYSVDVLAQGGHATVCVPRTRDVIRSGITFEGETVNHESTIETCKFLTWALGLDGAVGFQFREDSEGQPMLLECNPRVQGTMVHSTLAGANIINWAVQSALGEKIFVHDPEWGVKIRRYWGCSVAS